MWNYLTAPFVFVAPGVQAREIEPWQEDGETWRRLAVTFPETHRQPQRRAGLLLRRPAHAAAHGLLARRDRQPAGRPLHARPETFDGFVFPTRRRVHLHDAEGRADQSFAPITVDVRTVTVTKGASS